MHLTRFWAGSSVGIDYSDNSSEISRTSKIFDPELQRRTEFCILKDFLPNSKSTRNFWIKLIQHSTYIIFLCYGTKAKAKTKEGNINQIQQTKTYKMISKYYPNIIQIIQRRMCIPEVKMVSDLEIGRLNQENWPKKEKTLGIG